MNEATFIPVANSSNVGAVRYDDATKELQVRYQSGATYAYEGVPADVAKQIVESAPDADTSTGKLVNGLIKGGGYAFNKL